MRLDDFMYNGDAYGGDMYGNFGGFGGYGGYTPEAYVAPAPVASGLDALAAQPVAAPMATPPGAYAMGQVEAPFGTYDRTLSAVGLGPQADPRSMYTPEQLAYFDEQAAYTAAQKALGYDVTPLKQFVTSAPIYDRREDTAGGTVAPSDNFQRPRGQNRYLTPEEVDAQMAAANAFSPDIADRFGTNIIADPAGEGGYSASTRVSYADQPFRLYNKGKLVFEGVGRDDALKATQMAQGFTDVGGNKADWKLETKLGPTAGYTTVAEDAADVSGLMGAFINYGVPLLVAAAIGPAAFGQLAAGIGAATGAGAAASAALTAGVIGGVGGGLSQALQGSSVGDIAKAAGLSAATAGAMQGSGAADLLRTSLGAPSFGEAAKSAIADAAAQAAPSALSSVAQALPAELGEILVTASRDALPGLLSGAATSAIGSGLSSVGNSLLTPKLEPLNPQMQTPDTSLAAQAPPSSLAVSPDELAGITVTGSRVPSNILTDVGSALATLPSLAVQQPSTPAEPPAEQQQVAGDDEEILVEAPKEPPSVINTPAIPFAPPPPLAVQPIPEIQAPTTPPEQPADEEILVEAPRVPDFTVVPPIPFAPPPPLAVQPIPEIQAPTTPPEQPADEEIKVTAPRIPPSVIGLPPIPFNPIPDTGNLKQPEPDLQPKDKKLSVSDYLKIAGLLAPLIPDGDGNKGTAAGVIPGGLGGLNPIFSEKLPTAGTNIPGGVGTASNFAPRPITDEDWLTYGQRPEKSFFNYVPQPTGMAHGGSLAAKRGGRPSRSSFAVNGPGTGRSDDIPAVLSDGEYVIDAETVALLGDGSSKAGAQKLDDLRVKIRKHKGQRLSQGRFSSDAKKPEAYLTGGRI